MAPHPKQITVCALYLASNADHHHIPLSEFLSAFRNVREEDVKAFELILLQSLRFKLDTQHPMKELAGGAIEIAVINEEDQLGITSTARGSINRINSAVDQAKRVLNTVAQMTDPYFLYSPGQIWLAARMVADEALVKVYLDGKLADLPTYQADGTLKPKLMHNKYPHVRIYSNPIARWKTPPSGARSSVSAGNEESAKIEKRTTLSHL
jgi:cyclin H